MKSILALFLCVSLAVSVYAGEEVRKSKKSVGRKSKASRSQKSVHKSSRKSICESDSLRISSCEPSFEPLVSPICTAELESIVYAPGHEMKEYYFRILRDVLAILEPLVDPLNNQNAFSAIKQIASTYNVSVTLQSAIPQFSTIINADGTIQSGPVNFGRVVDPTYLNEFGFVNASGGVYQVAGSINTCRGYVLVIITYPSTTQVNPGPGPSPDPNFL